MNELAFASMFHMSPSAALRALQDQMKSALERRNDKELKALCRQFSEFTLPRLEAAQLNAPQDLVEQHG